MSNYKNASLVLKNYDLPLNGSNNYGYTDQYRTVMTWNNINLRTLLGDMYDTYDLFTLELNQIVASIGTGVFGTAAHDRTVLMKISGLPFINQTYNFKNGCNTNKAIIGGLTFPASTLTTSTFQIYSNSNLIVFGKNQDLCNITIEYTKGDDTAITTTNASPPTTFLFTIHGVINEPNYKTDKRLF